jgi:hypothetical protein
MSAINGANNIIRNPRWDSGLYELVNIVKDKGHQPIVYVAGALGRLFTAANLAEIYSVKMNSKQGINP